MEEKKETISEKINDIPVESKKKTKKKDKKNFKDLKDLLDNIQENNKAVTTRKKKKKKNKKEISKETGKIELNNNNNEILDSEKGKKTIDIEEIKEIKNNTTTESILSSSFSNSKEYNNTIDTQNDKLAIINKENKEESQNIKPQNYILKKIENNNDLEKNIFNNKEDEKNNNNKFHSPMCEYYEESEKQLKKIISEIVDYKKSINFVGKDIILSTEFNFNNDKFIKINMFNKMISGQYNIYNNSIYFNINKYINLDLNNTVYNKYNFGINNCFNNIYYPNNLNINLFCNNIYLNGNESKTNKNIDNIFNECKENKFDSKDDTNSNVFSNLNNFFFQKAFSFDENNNNSSEKNESSKIFDKLNIIFNSKNNLKNSNPIIFNFTQHNNNYNCNNIYNNYNNNKFKTTENKSERHNDINAKKNTFCRRPNDWVCSKCCNLNFAFRIYCNRCCAPKDFLLNINNNH